MNALGANDPAAEYILVIGATGAGKTSFINEVSRSSLTVSDDIESCTSEIQLSKPFECKGRTIRLIDTPGFNNSNKTDDFVATEIGLWFRKFCNSQRSLIGAIYLQSLESQRAGNMVVRNVETFWKALSGMAAKNVVIATTKWDLLQSEIAEKRHRKFCESPQFVEPLANHEAWFMECKRGNCYKVVEEVIRRKGNLALGFQEGSLSKIEAILVIGASGAGKTSFINEVSGSQLEVGDDVDCCTQEVQLSQSFVHQSRIISMIDTPGLDGSDEINTQVMADIMLWLGKFQGRLIGVIYMYSLENQRAGSSVIRNMETFKNVIGDAVTKHAIIATTKSETLSPEVAKTRHEQFANSDKLFRPLEKKGVQLMQYRKKDGMEIIDRLLQREGVITIGRQKLVPQNERNGATAVGIGNTGMLRALDNDTPETKYILVMGASKSGKTSFINEVSHSNLPVSANSESCTSEVQFSLPFDFNSHKIKLIDTPGFNSSNKSDAQVLAEIALWLGKFYTKKKLLLGVIYLHSIESDFTRSTARNFEIFRKAIGDRAAKATVVAITKCDLVSTKEEPARSAAIFDRNDAFKTLEDDGAIIMDCWEGRRHELLEAVVPRIQSGNPLQIQQEIFILKEKVRRTEAGQELEKQLIQEYEHLLQTHKEHIGQLSSENRPAQEIRTAKREYRKEEKEKKKELKSGQRALNQSLDGGSGVFSSLLSRLTGTDATTI